MENKYAGKRIKYIDTRLNKNKMHEMFIAKHPTVKYGYKYFAKFFKENFNYRFGWPQIDSCCICQYDRNFHDV